MTVLIKNGTLIDPKNNINEKLDIVLEDKKVKEIGKNIREDSVGYNKFNHVIDAKGMIISPGFIDVYANFCDPGVTTKEDLKSGSLSSVKGGFTTIILGVDNVPSTGEVNVIEYIHKYSSIMPVNIFTTSSLRYGKQLDEYSDLTFLSTHGALDFFEGQKPIENKDFLKNTLKKVKSLNKVFGLYSEDQKKVKVNGILKGEVCDRLGVKFATPKEAEFTDLKINFDIAKEVGTKVLFTNVTSPESIEFFKNEKIDTTFAATPAINLILNDTAFGEGNTNAKMLPPLREEQDRKALVEGVKNGVIDIIYSNHNPQLKEDKEVKFKDAINGSIGLETLLGVVGKVLVYENKMNWSDVIAKFTINPAKIFSIDKDGIGEIKIGEYANIVIFDPNEEWQLNKEDIVSKSKNTPLIGVKLKAKVKYTIHNGKLVYMDSNIENLHNSLMEKKEENVESEENKLDKENQKSHRVKNKLFREVFGSLKKDKVEEPETSGSI